MPNQRVSLEEIRAKRLAKEARDSKTIDNKELTPLIPIPSDELRPEPAVPMVTQYPGSVADDQQSVTDSPEPVPASAPATVVVKGKGLTTATNLEDFLASATPEQLQRLRVLAAANGMATETSAMTGHSVKLPDGSMQVTVMLEPLIVEQLAIWAEGDGISLEEEAQKRISESISNYMFGDWSATVEQPVVVAAPVVPVVPVVPVAAAK
jgi:hypothetical protein